MRIVAEHPRLATLVAFALVALMLLTGLIARATAGTAGLSSPSLQAQLIQLRRENAQLRIEAQRQARQLAADRTQAQSLTGELWAARTHPQRAQPQRHGGRRG